MFSNYIKSLHTFKNFSIVKAIDFKRRAAENGKRDHEIPVGEALRSQSNSKSTNIGVNFFPFLLQNSSPFPDKIECIFTTQQCKITSHMTFGTLQQNYQKTSRIIKL